MTKLQIIHPPTPQEVAYIRQGRDLFTKLFPEPIHDFAAPSWDVRHLRTSQHKKSNARVYFTRHGSLTEPLPARFGDVIKAYVLLNRAEVGTLHLRVEAARMLWKAVEPRLEGHPEFFHWELVSEADLLATEQQMLQHWGRAATYKRCTQLQFMMRVLAAASGGIVRPMEPVFVTPRQEDSERYTLDGQRERMARLPPDEAICAVGDIYAKYAKEPADRLIACVLAVLLATALRIGEVLTLPLDCWVSEGEGQKRRWGIRYHKEKSRGGQKQLAVRWMTPSQADLARDAIQEAYKLTVAARHRAEILEARPDTVLLPGIADNAELRSAEVARLLGMESVCVSKISAAKLPRIKVTPSNGQWASYVYRAADLSVYLLSLRVRHLWAVDRRDGTYQMLSESLFIAPLNFFHRTRGTNPLLVELVTEQKINDFLGGRVCHGAPVTPSAFERFGIKSSAGTFFKMHTHQFRHWATTKAAAVGVADDVIARWQGREHIGDLAAYKHLTPAERLATLKGALKSGRAKGRLSEAYFSLKEDVRDAFLEGQLQAVHVTPLGLCTHDFKVAPCPKMLNCVKECDDYLFDTANETHRQNLVKLRQRTQLTLEQALAQKDQGEQDLSENWIAEARATLAGVQQVLSTKPSGDTTIIRPFGGSGSRFEPLKEN